MKERGGIHNRRFEHVALDVSTQIKKSALCPPFKRGELVEWNSEAGWVGGIIIKKVIADVLFKGYVHHASRDEPQPRAEKRTRR